MIVIIQLSLKLFKVTDYKAPMVLSFWQLFGSGHTLRVWAIFCDLQMVMVTILINGTQ